MNNINLTNVNKIFFIGIGGIGMSALARMMHHEGKMVIGSDTDNNQIMRNLRGEGYLVHVGQSEDIIPDDVDVVVYSEAVADYHPEFLENIEEQFSASVLSYPELLGLISKEKFTIAVIGTHGKTTTTAMMATALVDAEKKPTGIVGSILAREHSNYVPGTSDIFIVEACEYKRSFLQIHPDILVITNIEEDHMDYYKDLADIQAAFRGVTHHLPDDGIIIANPNDNVVSEVLDGVSQKIIDYTQYIDSNLGLRVPSEYNFQNAACVLAAADYLDIDMQTVRRSLENFQGVWRRFEYKGKTRRDELIYDDYAHHPTEIRGALAAAKKMFPDQELIVVFEPHLYSRTKVLFDDFTTSFADADRVILVPIYYARERDDGSVSSQQLANAINQTGTDAWAARSYDHVIEHISTTETTGAVIMTVGAGPVYTIGERILKERGL